MILIVRTLALTLMSFWFAGSPVSNRGEMRIIRPIDISSASGTSQAASQEVHPYELTISAADTIFTPQQPAKIRVKIDNQRGDKLNLKQLGSITLCMSTNEKEPRFLRRGDLYIAYFQLHDQVIENGTSHDFELDLAKSNWNDSISSEVDLLNRPNLFTKLPAGDYFFYIELVDPRHPFDEKRRLITIKSNALAVKKHEN